MKSIKVDIFCFITLNVVCFKKIKMSKESFSLKNKNSTWEKLKRVSIAKSTKIVKSEKTFTKKKFKKSPIKSSSMSKSKP